MAQSRRGRGVARPRASAGTAGWALAVVVLSAATFPVWLAWHFLDGPGADQWLGALGTLAVAAVLGLRHLSPRTTWMATAAPFAGVGWWSLVGDPRTAGTGDGLGQLGALVTLLLSWPVLAFGIAGAVVVTVRFSGVAWWLWPGEPRGGADTSTALTRLTAHGLRGRFLLWARGHRDGTSYATPWSYAAAEEWSPQLRVELAPRTGAVVVHRGDGVGRARVGFFVDGRRVARVGRGRRRIVVVPAGVHRVGAVGRSADVETELRVEVPDGGWAHLELCSRTTTSGLRQMQPGEPETSRLS